MEGLSSKCSINRALYSSWTSGQQRLACYNARYFKQLLVTVYILSTRQVLFKPTAMLSCANLFLSALNEALGACKLSACSIRLLTIFYFSLGIVQKSCVHATATLWWYEWCNYSDMYHCSNHLKNTSHVISALKDKVLERTLAHILSSSLEIPSHSPMTPTKNSEDYCERFFEEVLLQFCRCRTKEWNFSELGRSLNLDP